tara:strand:+ start:1340 stop:2164 length:825 start_codon:yes stop_codon:yes gene_type:complete
MVKYKIEDKNVLITGGADGLGRCLIDELIKKNCTITCIDHDEEKLDSLDHKNVKKILCDLRNLDETNHLLKKLEGEKYDILINNAGYEIGSLLKEISIKDFIDNYNCNFFSHVILIKEFIGNLSSRNGNTKIINMVSDTAFRAIPTRSSYCSSKASFRNFTEAMRVELKIYNIDCITITPPKLDTNFFKKIQYFGYLNKEKLPYSDSRPFYPTSKFAKQIITGIENNKKHIGVFSITKIFLFINYLFPPIGDFMVEKLSTWKKIKEKIMIGTKI